VDLHRFPQLAVSIECVIENFKRMGLWSEQVRLVKGWFKDTIPAAPVGKIAVLRLNGDLYESTIQVLGGFYPRLSPSGFCIIDDYGAMESCRAAVEDYRREHGVTAPIVNIDGKGVLWRKSRYTIE
jgi:O-methyltransferase